MHTGLSVCLHGCRRKHQKIENRRFYYHCDRLGIAVIQDFPGGRSGFGNATIDAQFRMEVSQLYNELYARESCGVN